MRYDELLRAIEKTVLAAKIPGSVDLVRESPDEREFTVGELLSTPRIPGEPTFEDSRVIRELIDRRIDLKLIAISGHVDMQHRLRTSEVDIVHAVANRRFTPGSAVANEVARIIDRSIDGALLDSGIPQPLVSR